MTITRRSHRFGKPASADSFRGIPFIPGFRDQQTSTADESDHTLFAGLSTLEVLSQPIGSPMSAEDMAVQRRRDRADDRLDDALAEVAAEQAKSRIRNRDTLARLDKALPPNAWLIDAGTWTARPAFAALIPPGLAANRRYQIATHEVGHITAALYYGMLRADDSIVAKIADDHGEARHLRARDEQGTREHATIILAGACAEALLTDAMGPSSRGDADSIESALNMFPRRDRCSIQSECVAIAQEIIESNLPLIARLSNHLYAHGTLSGADVHQLVS